MEKRKHILQSVENNTTRQQKCYPSAYHQGSGRDSDFSHQSDRDRGNHDRDDWNKDSCSSDGYPSRDFGSKYHPRSRSPPLKDLDKPSDRQAAHLALVLQLPFLLHSWPQPVTIYLLTTGIKKVVLKLLNTDLAKKPLKLRSSPLMLEWLSWRNNSQIFALMDLSLCPT